MHMPTVLILITIIFNSLKILCPKSTENKKYMFDLIIVKYIIKLQH